MFKVFGKVSFGREVLIGTFDSYEKAVKILKENQARFEKSYGSVWISKG